MSFSSIAMKISFEDAVDWAPLPVLDSSAELESELDFCWPQPAKRLSKAIDKIADATIRREVVCDVFLWVGFIILWMGFLIAKYWVETNINSELGLCLFLLLDVF